MIASVPVSIPRGRIRAPFTGIPIPGERPLILYTERLRLALAGVTVTDAAVIDTTRVNGNHYSILPVGLAPGRAGETVRALEVTYVHGKRGKGRGRGRVVLYDLGYSKDGGVHRYRQSVITTELRSWADSQRTTKTKKVTGAGKGKGSAARLQRIAQSIRRAEKEKKALYLPDHPPLHPLLRAKRDYDYCGKDHYRKLEWRWHDERYHRKQLAAVTGRVLQRKITGTTGYKLLREMGYTVKTYSELRTHERDRRPSQDEYWRHLPEFCGCLGEPGRPEDYSTRLDDEGLDQYQRHARARVEYLANRRMAESLDIQIAEMRRMALEGC